MMLMFTSNQPTGLIQAPYPPFGLVTAVFFGLAAFLFLVGVYTSAISVSQEGVSGNIYRTMLNN
ncbi:MAG: hypothetical protein WA421_03860 [Nitrososphaeraceae archaeon]